MTMKNVTKHSDIKFLTTDRRRNHLVFKPNYLTTTWFSEKLLAKEMNKTEVKINKPVYLFLSFVNISKIAMY